MLPDWELEIFFFLIVPVLEGGLLLVVPLEGVDLVTLVFEIRPVRDPVEVVVAVPEVLRIPLTPWFWRVLLFSWSLRTM